jgi:nucleolar protein 6
MNTGDKLTKKQKKTLAFRERKTGKRKDHNASFMDAENSNDVPAMEDQDMADAQSDPVEVEMEERSENGRSSFENNSKGKAKTKHRDEQTGEKPKKRQREGEEITMEHAQQTKRAKILDTVRETDEKEVAKTQRFLLFVGMQLFIMTFLSLSSLL